MKQRFSRPPTRPPARLHARLMALAVMAACIAFDANAARLAMVVGNDNYQNASKLRNARNDAQTLGRELEAAGFKVTRVLDATRDTLNDSIDGFLRRVEKGDEVVFFFSGHGSQPPQMGPYLLPVDIRVTGERAIQRDGLSLEQLVDDLNKRARFSLIIVDACRDDPFRETTAGRGLPAGSGLGRIEPPKGSMIIMAASKGQQALDRLGNTDTVPNGLFTRELVKQIRTAGLSASDMLKRVRSSVEASAATVNHAQRPSLVDESSSDFFFYPGNGAAPAPAPAPRAELRDPGTDTRTGAGPGASHACTRARARHDLQQPAAPRADTFTHRAAFHAGWRLQPAAGIRRLGSGRPRQHARGFRILHRAVPRWPLHAAGAHPRAGHGRQRGACTAPAPAARPAAGANNPQAEFEVWDRAATSKLKADYENYLALYPNGRYVDLARAALKKF